MKIRTKRETAKTPNREPTPIRLDPLAFERLMRTAAEIDTADMRIKLIKREQADLLAKIDPEGKLAAFDTQIEEERHKVAALKQKYNGISLEEGKRLGIDLASCSFDEAGILYTY